MTKKLTARWYGEPPAIGDYLMSKLRPRGAYRILAVREMGASSDVPIDLHGQPTRKLELQCEVIAVADVPVGATVYDWQWSSRDRKGTVWR